MIKRGAFVNKVENGEFFFIIFLLIELLVNHVLFLLIVELNTLCPPPPLGGGCTLATACELGRSFDIWMKLKLNYPPSTRNLLARMTT